MMEEKRREEKRREAKGGGAMLNNDLGSTIPEEAIQMQNEIIGYVRLLREYMTTSEARELFSKLEEAEAKNTSLLEKAAYRKGHADGVRLLMGHALRKASKNDSLRLVKSDPVKLCRKVSMLNNKYATK